MLEQRADSMAGCRKCPSFVPGWSFLRSMEPVRPDEEASGYGSSKVDADGGVLVAPACKHMEMTAFPATLCCVHLVFDDWRNIFIPQKRLD